MQRGQHFGPLGFANLTYAPFRVYFLSVVDMINKDIHVIITFHSDVIMGGADPSSGDHNVIFG